jgi:hypothetical protein
MRTAGDIDMESGNLRQRQKNTRKGYSLEVSTRKRSSRSWDPKTR